MPFRITRPLAAAILLALAGSPTATFADGIATCDGCTVARMDATAAAQGPGPVYVVDHATPKLRFYRVHAESSGKPRLESLPVPSGMEQMLRDRNAALSTGIATVTIPVEAGNEWPAGRFGGDPLERFEGRHIDAFEVISNATLRHQLELALARRWETGDAPVDVLTATLAARFEAAVHAKTGAPLVHIIGIRWSDGSTTRFRTGTGDETDATYSVGESRDASGVLMPDAAMLGADAAALYGGDHSFANHDQLEDWIALARLYGVPVSDGGAREAGTVVRCERDETRDRMVCARG